MIACDPHSASPPPGPAETRRHGRPRARTPAGRTAPRWRRCRRHPGTTRRCSSAATTDRNRPPPAGPPTAPPPCRRAPAVVPDPAAYAPGTTPPSLVPTSRATTPSPTNDPRRASASPPHTTRKRTRPARARSTRQPAPATTDGAPRPDRNRPALINQIRRKDPGQHPQRDVIGQPLITLRLDPTSPRHSLRITTMSS